MSGKFLQVFAFIAISTTVASSTILMFQQPSYSQATTGCAATSGNKLQACPPRPVPEPITVVGTLIGGAAVWSLKKKLNHSSKQ
jgi:hypothetical protein